MFWCLRYIYKVFCGHVAKYWYTHDTSLLGDHSKSVRFEKRNVKTLATWTLFGGYFHVRDTLVWELKLFLFYRIEMFRYNIAFTIDTLVQDYSISFANTLEIMIEHYVVTHIVYQISCVFCCFFTNRYLFIVYHTRWPLPSSLRDLVWFRCKT